MIKGRSALSAPNSPWTNSAISRTGSFLDDDTAAEDDELGAAGRYEPLGLLHVDAVGVVHSGRKMRDRGPIGPQDRWPDSSSARPSAARSDVRPSSNRAPERDG